ncbi:MAG: sensor histidine kinase, partial [Phycicoccus sp.]
MRRIFVLTAVRSVGVAAAAVVVAAVVARYLLGLPVPDDVPLADIAVVAGAALLGAAVAALGSVWLATREADRVGDLLATLRSRAERLGDGDSRPVPLASGIDELDHLDGTLLRGAQQGARRLAAERDFAADASHQLRTPLTALLMRLEEISVTSDLQVVAEEAHIAIGQVERLSRVVDELMSRTRSGVEANPAVSLDSVLASLQREWQPAFAAAKRSVHVHGERGLRVRATPVTLGQILTTLLENSLSHGSGTV